jgi:hypothetical protein
MRSWERERGWWWKLTSYFISKKKKPKLSVIDI